MLAQIKCLLHIAQHIPFQMPDVVCVVEMCRSLKSLAWAGAVGLFLALGFSSLTVVLVVLAALQGDLASISWLPNPDLTGPDIKDKILGVFSTLPVIALAYVCHYNVHPLVTDHYAARIWSAWKLPFCCLFFRH